MAYDANKDVQIEDLGIVKLDDKTRLEIGLWSYNNGPAKYRVSKVTIGKVTRDGSSIYRETILKASQEEWSKIVEAIGITTKTPPAID